MGIRLDRTTLLQLLEMAQPGLTPREIIEQSACYIFKNGWIITYNGEIACRVASGLDKGLTGAVQAAPLLAVLQKIPEDEIELEPSDSELVIVGKRRRAGIRLEKEILLPIGTVEKPGEWQDLPETFSDALGMVQEATSMDESRFVMTCVHLHPKRIEACDDFQAFRFRLALKGITKPTLIKKDSAKHITALGMTQIAESENFLHFKSPSKLILSCRRYSEGYVEDFPELDKVLDVSGTPTSLPKGLAEAAERASIFSSENADNDHVMLELRPGKVRIRGQGVSGWYQETSNISYQGEPMKMLIPPKLLTELVKRHTNCEMTSERLKINGDDKKWEYVSCLEKMEDPA